MTARDITAAKRDERAGINSLYLADLAESSTVDWGKLVGNKGSSDRAWCALVIPGLRGSRFARHGWDALSPTVPPAWLQMQLNGFLPDVHVLFALEALFPQGAAHDAH